MSLFAVLRPPPRTTGPARPAMNVASLGALILADDAARTLRKTADCLEIAFDMGTGQNLGVLVREGEVRILTGPADDDSPEVDEEHGEPIEDDDDSEVEDVAGALISKLQAASGWHVESEHLLGFDPSGVCPACEIECFEWQERCSVCDAELEDENEEPKELEPEDPDEPDESPRAQRLLQALLREELIELASRRNAPMVEGRLANHLGHGMGSPAQLLDLLVSLKEVAEVFASEDDIARLLDA